MTRGVIWTLAIGLLLSVCSCNESGIKEKMSQILGQHIIIPYDKLEKRDCSLFGETYNNEKRFTLVLYTDGNQCVPCEIVSFSSLEKMNRNDSLWQELRKVYIFDVKPDNATSLYMKLCKFRIEQDVFFDTCGVFRKSNPFIPDSKLYHSFILDNNGTVKLIGNPFKNEKLRHLLSTIIKEH